MHVCVIKNLEKLWRTFIAEMFIVILLKYTDNVLWCGINPQILKSYLALYYTLIFKVQKA